MPDNNDYEKKIVCFFQEKEKREKDRQNLVMPTKDLSDYLTFKQWKRECKRGRELVAKGC